jgi:cold shock CspA family protein
MRSAQRCRDFVGDEEVCREGLPWVEDGQRVLFTVTCGGGSQLCHGDDVPSKGSEEAR